jgi:hypothetical protein
MYITVHKKYTSTHTSPPINSPDVSRDESALLLCCPAGPPGKRIPPERSTAVNACLFNSLSGSTSAPLLHAVTTPRKLQWFSQQEVLLWYQIESVQWLDECYQFISLSDPLCSGKTHSGAERCQKLTMMLCTGHTLPMGLSERYCCKPPCKVFFNTNKKGSKKGENERGKKREDRRSSRKRVSVSTLDY